MTTRLFMPVVSGSRFMRVGSRPVTQAAVPSSRPAAAPLVTYPASAPVWRAMTELAAACSSAMSTHDRPASAIASATSGAMIEPLRRVAGPEALMMVRTPKRW